MSAKDLHSQDDSVAKLPRPGSVKPLSQSIFIFEKKSLDSKSSAVDETDVTER